MPKIDISEHIVIDPEICHGQMTFKGTRVPVETFMTFLGKGYSVDVLLQNWPEINRKAVQEAVSLATQAFLERYNAPSQQVMIKRPLAQVS